MAEERLGGELLKGHVTTLILSVVATRPAYGYAIMKALAKRSNDIFTLGQGTIYPMLYSLEEQGYIRSHIEVVDGRRRRVYALTRSGRRKLETQTQQWRVFQAAMNKLVLAR